MCNRIMIIKKSFLTAGVALMLIIFGSVFAFAQEKKIYPGGIVYEFSDKETYPFSSAEEYVLSNDNNTYGRLFISGDISQTEPVGDGIDTFCVGEGNVSFTYQYSDLLLNASLDEWHLEKDNGKKIDTISLPKAIGKGALLLQTSKDGINWVDAYTSCNHFEALPVNNDSFYTTSDVQELNGCYYRVVVAYRTSIRTADRWVADKYDYKKQSEVYRIYIYDSAKDLSTPSTSFRLGEVTASNKSYTESKPLNFKDDHYGWNIGDFFVSGYTDKRDINGVPVFLKNPQDEVALWFKLEQNIDCLNNQENLKITYNDAGYDEHFQTPKMDFGRGTLIIRYCDYHNTPRVVPYTNYLEASATLGTNTKVQLFEEGDYEVSLDYGITNTNFIDTYRYYKINFKFSVRNSNCMVYPRDAKTGGELMNGAIAPNGFFLDLANSRYLNINIKKYNLLDKGYDFLEDTKFNYSGKDGDKFTSEGLYVITVHNNYTDKETVKNIYVGNNELLIAHVVTGKPLAEIKELIDNGATVQSDGTIKMPDKKPDAGALFLEYTTSGTNPNNEEIVLEISLSDPLTKEFSTEEGPITFVAGKAEVHVFPGESVCINELPAGIGYTINPIGKKDDESIITVRVNEKVVENISGIVHKDFQEEVSINSQRDIQETVTEIETEIIEEEIPIESNEEPTTLASSEYEPPVIVPETTEESATEVTTEVETDPSTNDGTDNQESGKKNGAPIWLLLVIAAICGAGCWIMKTRSDKKEQK